MKKKYLIACTGVLFLVLTMSLSKAYANHGHHESGFGDGLDGMFFMKAHAILENHDELGLSEDAVKAIKSLKLETKKALIRQDAEIEVVDLDIKTKLHDYPVEVEAVDKLVDQKYELKKAKAKNLVEALAKLKGALTKDQYDKLHKLWESREKGEHGERG